MAIAERVNKRGRRRVIVFCPVCGKIIRTSRHRGTYMFAHEHPTIIIVYEDGNIIVPNIKSMPEGWKRTLYHALYQASKEEGGRITYDLDAFISLLKEMFRGD